MKFLWNSLSNLDSLWSNQKDQSHRFDLDYERRLRMFDIIKAEDNSVHHVKDIEPAWSMT